MKVLLVIPSLNPELGDPSEVAIHTVSSLRDAGVEAEIATTNDNGATVFDVPLGERVEFRGVPAYFFARSRLRKKEYIFSAPLTAWLARHLADYDLVDIHYLFSYSSTAASIISRIRGVPYIVRTMGQLAPWSLAQSARRKRIYARIFDRSMLNHAVGIHCTTVPEAADVHAFGVRAPTFVIPLGVPEPAPIAGAKEILRSRYGIPAQRKIVLFLSRLHRKKRAERLIEATAEIQSRRLSDIHLVLGGSGEREYEAALRRLVRDRGVEDRVTFTGFVQGADKDLLLQGSDIFCLPSYSENFGLAVIEAIAAGLPVVLAPGVQVAEEISAAGAGLITDPDDPEFHNVLLRVIGDQQYQAGLRRAGLDLVRRRYSWSSIGRALAATLSELV